MLLASVADEPCGGKKTNPSHQVEAESNSIQSERWRGWGRRDLPAFGQTLDRRRRRRVTHYFSIPFSSRSIQSIGVVIAVFVDGGSGGGDVHQH